MRMRGKMPNRSDRFFRTHMASKRRLAASGTWSSTYERKQLARLIRLPLEIGLAGMAQGVELA